MFVSAEAPVDPNFPAASAGQADLAHGGLLTGVSQAAYGDGLTGLARVGPLGEVPGMSKLVQVQVLDVVTRGEALCSRCGGRLPRRAAGCSLPWMPASG